MLEVRRVEPDDWATMREIRLAALQDAPYAFESTYERESAFAEADWRTRLTRPTAATYLVFDPELGELPVGIAGGYISQHTGLPELVAMWVRPQARGRGVAGALLDRVIAWARTTGGEQIQLWVTDPNEPALRLYQRYGFGFAGEKGPMPANPVLIEMRMVRAL